MSPAPPALHLEFARFAGETAEHFNFNKSLGQIYGLLYIRGAPLALGEICAALSMSKGNASINLRLLESWGAVRPVSRVGTRQDYYEADTDVKGLILRRLREGLTKRLDRAEEGFERLLTSAHASADSRRLQDLRGLLAKSRKTLGFISRWLA